MKRPEQMHVEDVADVSCRQLLEVAGPQEPGVVHNGVHPAEGVEGRVDHCHASLRRRHVAGRGDGCASCVGDAFCHALGPAGARLVVDRDVVDDYRCATRREPDGVRAAEAAPGPSDDDRLPFEGDSGHRAVQPPSTGMVTPVT